MEYNGTPRDDAFTQGCRDVIRSLTYEAILACTVYAAPMLFMIGPASILTNHSLVLIALTTLLHYEALRAMHAILPPLAIPKRTKVLVVIFGAFAAHFGEIAIYGAALYVLIRYMGVGQLSGSLPFSFENCLYFSAETYTSLGFGDITPAGPVRLLSGVEALNGLLLIGWSASFTYISMERFWSPNAVDGRP